MGRHAFAALSSTCSSVSFSDGEFYAKKGDLVGMILVFRILR